MIIVIEKKSGESNEICEDGEKKSGGGVVTQKFAHVKLRINMYKQTYACTLFCARNHHRKIELKFYRTSAL